MPEPSGARRGRLHTPGFWRSRQVVASSCRRASLLRQQQLAPVCRCHGARHRKSRDAIVRRLILVTTHISRPAFGTVGTYHGWQMSVSMTPSVSGQLALLWHVPHLPEARSSCSSRGAAAQSNCMSLACVATLQLTYTRRRAPQDRRYLTRR